MKRLQMSLVGPALLGLTLLFLQSCGPSHVAVAQIINTIQDYFSDPVSPIGDKLPEVTFERITLDGEMGYFIKDDDMGNLYTALSDWLLWSKQKIAQVEAYRQQATDNNAHSGVAGNGDPLHALE